MRVFSAISESLDAKTSLKNENSFFAIVVSYSLTVGAIAAFISRYMIFFENFSKSAIDSIIMLGFVIIFISLSQLLKNEIMKMYIYSILTSLISLFSLIRFFYIIGPAVWMTSIVLLITILIYSRIEFILIYTTSLILSSLYMLINPAEFDNWKGFYIAQIIIIGLIMYTAISVYKVIKKRQFKIYEQHQDIRMTEEKLYATLNSVGGWSDCC